jgi:hypothetical protein
MPLPPLPASNTKRYFLTQVADTYQHTMMVRVGPAVTDAAAITELAALCAIFVPIAFVSTAWTALSVAQAGSDVRNPVPGWTTIVGTSAGNQPDLTRPYAWQYKGRSADGRKCKLFVYGLSPTVPDTYEMDPILAGSALKSAQVRLNSQPGFYLSISGQQPAWYDRLTVAPNDHWIGVARG